MKIALYLSNIIVLEKRNQTAMMWTAQGCGNAPMRSKRPWAHFLSHSSMRSPSYAVAVNVNAAILSARAPAICLKHIWSPSILVKGVHLVPVLPGYTDEQPRLCGALSESGRRERRWWRALLLPSLIAHFYYLPLSFVCNSSVCHSFPWV